MVWYILIHIMILTLDSVRTCHPYGLVYTDSYYDFDSTYCSNLWNKFLYTQFTHEYYTAFKEYLMKDVDRKLTNMIKI